MISIICIYENRRDYNEKLGQSLILLEDCAYELIVKKRVGDYLQNVDQAIHEANNEIIVIVNENVYLPTTFMNELKAFEDMSFGAVGIRGRAKRIIKNGICNVIGDELVMLHKSDYLLHPFDGSYGQHYLVDYCYALKQAGKDNYVMDLHIGFEHNTTDDPVIICHLLKKYPTMLSIDTMNDYYPTSLTGKVKKQISDRFHLKQ